MDGIKFDVDALLGVLDVRKQLAVVSLSVGVDLHVVAAGQTAAVVALVKLDDDFLCSMKIEPDFYLAEIRLCAFQTV